VAYLYINKKISVYMGIEDIPAMHLRVRNSLNPKPAIQETMRDFQYSFDRSFGGRFLLLDVIPTFKKNPVSDKSFLFSMGGRDDSNLLSEYLRLLYYDFRINSNDYRFNPVNEGFLQIRGVSGRDAMIFSELRNSSSGFDANLTGLARNYMEKSGPDLGIILSNERFA
jgi:hypothetical protein